MSDSIRGMVPELEEDQVQQIQETIIVSAIELSSKGKKNIVIGNLIGISVENDIKLDARIKTDEAYQISKSILQGQELKCDGFQIHYSEDGFRVAGPFKIMSHKMLDFDHSSKMCTLALDLTKETP